MGKIIFHFLLFIPLIIFSAKGENAFKNKIQKENNTKTSTTKNNNELKKIELAIKYEDIRDILIKNNEDLKKYKSRINQSIDLLKSNKSAWYPRLDISSDELPKFITGNTTNKFSTNTSTNQLKYGISKNLEWDLINPSRRLNIALAKKDLTNAELIYLSSLDKLYFEAKKIFFEIQTAIKEIEVAKESLNVSEFAFNEAKNRFDMGIGNKMEVLEAEFQKGRDEIFLAQTVGDLKVKKNLLAEILSLKEDYKIMPFPNTPIIGFWNYTFEESLKSSINTSKDLKIKSNNILINEKRAKLKLSQKKPTINIYNTYKISSSKGESDVVFPNSNNIIKNSNNTTGLKFSLRLLDGGKVKEEFNSLKNKTQELEAERSKEILNIENELKNSFTNLKINKQKIKIYFSQLKSAKESLNISLRRLEAGITTQREVVNLQRDVKEVERNYIKSLSEYNIVIAKLNLITELNESKVCNLNSLEDKDFSEFLIKNNILICKS